MKVPAKEKILQFALSFILLDLCNLVRIDFAVHRTEIDSQEIEKQGKEANNTRHPDNSVRYPVFVKVQHRLSKDFDLKIVSLHFVVQRLAVNIEKLGSFAFVVVHLLKYFHDCFVFGFLCSALQIGPMSRRM